MNAQNLYFNILTFEFPSANQTFYFTKNENGKGHKIHLTLCLEVIKNRHTTKAHQKAGFNFFDLVTFTYSEEALPSITWQIYGFTYKNATIVCFF